MKIPSLAALTCQEVVELVAEYLDGAMSAEDTARLEQHFHACTWCAVYVDQLKLTARALDQLSAATPPATDESGSRARLLASFKRLNDKDKDKDTP